MLQDFKSRGVRLKIFNLSKLDLDSYWDRCRTVSANGTPETLMQSVNFYSESFRELI